MAISMKQNKRNPDDFSITSWLYDEEKKSAQPKVVGHINFSVCDEIPSKILDLIDEEDKPEIKAWFRAIKKGRARDSLRSAGKDFIEICGKIEKGADEEVYNFAQITKLKECAESVTKSIRKLERKLSPEKNKEDESEGQEKTETVMESHTPETNNVISTYP